MSTGDESILTQKDIDTMAPLFFRKAAWRVTAGQKKEFSWDLRVSVCSERLEGYRLKIFSEEVITAATTVLEILNKKKHINFFHTIKKKTVFFHLKCSESVYFMKYLVGGWIVFSGLETK